MNGSAEARGFWNAVAKFYARQKIADPDAYQFKLQRTWQYFSSESLVLEFGCGTGSTALIHAPRVQSILALDSSKAMIKIAEEKRLSSNVRNIRFRAGTIFDLEATSAEFDVVLGLNVLHLVPDLKSTLKKTWELLKPGGVFVSSTACISDMPLFLRTILRAGGTLHLLPKVQFFSTHTLEENLREAGYTIKESCAPGKEKSVQFIVAKKQDLS